MVTWRTRLVVATLLTGILFQAAARREPFSRLWFGFLAGSLLSAILLIKVYREGQPE